MTNPLQSRGLGKELYTPSPEEVALAFGLGEATAARWMGDPATVDAAIADLLRDLPGKLDHLRYLTSVR